MPAARIALWADPRRADDQEIALPMTRTHDQEARVSVLVLLLLHALGATACSGGRADDVGSQHAANGISVVDGRTFDEVFVVVDTILLEETATVVTVSPRVVPDPQGGFIVADPPENQVRLYSSRGNLTQVFGDGAQQVAGIDRPQVARRLANGDILVANLQGPLTVIPAESQAAPIVIPVRLRTIRDFQIVSDGEVLLAGTDSSPPTATLFSVDLSARRITKRFLPPPQHLDRWATTYFSTVNTARRGNGIAAVHMLSDTLVILAPSGTELSRVPIPIAPFVIPIGPLPDLRTETARQAWSSQFTIMSKVWWIADDELIVQWHKPRPDRGMDWGLLRMNTSGVLVWAIAPAPYLFAVSGERFVFHDPQVDALNRWLVAKQRS